MQADGHSEDRTQGGWAQETGEGPREGQRSPPFGQSPNEDSSADAGLFQ